MKLVTNAIPAELTYFQVEGGVEPAILIPMYDNINNIHDAVVEIVLDGICTAVEDMIVGVGIYELNI